MAGSYDVIIIGAGPAGVSAALTVRNRGKSVAVIANPPETGSVYKAEKITNYPGIAGMSGREMAEAFFNQLSACGAEIINGRALQIMPFGEHFGVAVGNDFFECGTVIIAAGITREKLYPGESEFLGRGVSYCATCDGMLYKGKKVALIGGGKEAYHDVDFLRGICSEVLHFPENGKYEILGGMKADTVKYKGLDYSVDGVFIIKDTVSVTKLLNGLEYSEGRIVTDRQMQTSVPGVFAAGDCTGKPFQIAKAAGEGNIAALSACEFLDRNKKEK